MRYAGGLLGGIWLASLLSDLGDGRFDGAWLEENFESLNPGNTLWTKQYQLYANVDTEAERYLTFEKWWDGYTEMTQAEMHAIVENLFVGDKLEQGRLSLDRKKILDLKEIQRPMLLFASEGDNITPPQQALDWIIKAYGSVDRIRQLGKVIIYMIHPDVGHLGIFVGSKTARKEHMEIIRSIDMIEALAPGLYEMVIVDKGKKEGLSDYDVRFEERDMKDLLALNAGREEMTAEDADFRRVAAVSEMNDALYNTFLSPWVKMFSTELSAEILKQCHPLRVNKYIFSDRINPFMQFFKTLAPVVKELRSPVSADNPFTALERCVSDSIVAVLDGFQSVRDHFDEALFFAVYENPWMKLLFPETTPKEKPGRETETGAAEADPLTQENRQHGYDAMEKGGVVEGVIRMVMALEDSDHAIDRDALFRDERLLASNERFKTLSKKEFLHIAGTQARILQIDEDRALASLSALIAGSEDRRAALSLAQKIVMSGRAGSDRQKAVLSSIRSALQIE
jgi:hypothetical protein